MEIVAWTEGTLLVPYCSLLPPWLSITGLLMGAQVFLYFELLATPFAIYIISRIMLLHVSIKPGHTRVTFVTSGANKLTRGLVDFLMRPVGTAISKVLVTVLTFPRGGIHMFGSNVTLQSLSRCLFFVANFAYFLIRLHCFQNVLHIALLKFPAGIYP